ncbi:MAG TPA: XdhC family protein, partial [bacterium]|nr:XdhC family protein [bacterium]
MDILRTMLTLQEEGRPFCLATLVAVDGSSPRKAGTRMLVFPDGTIGGTIGGGALEKLVIRDAAALLRDGGESAKIVYKLSTKKVRGRRVAVETGMVCGGSAEVLFEPFVNRPKIVCCGGGHVAQALAKVAAAVDYPFWVIDNRAGFATPRLFPQAERRIKGDFVRQLATLPIDAGMAIVIVTYGHAHDAVCLKAALATRAGYIGMIGSRSKVRDVLARLKK